MHPYLPHSLDDHIEAGREHDKVVRHCKRLDVDRLAVAHQPLAQIHTQYVCTSIRTELDDALTEMQGRLDSAV